MPKIFLVHVSDLHIASPAYGHTHAGGHLLSGANGHDDSLSRELSGIWKRDLPIVLQARPNDPIRLVVTGDLTRYGDRLEFNLADQFLCGIWPAPRAGMLPVGLNSSKPDLAPVPGNHDQWAGAPYWALPRAYNPVGFQNRFLVMPSGPTSIASGRLHVELYGVDSNSGYKNAVFGFSRRQIGRIDGHELQQLETMLTNAPSAPAGAVRVRAILCHHGFDNLAFPPGPLDAADRDQLLKIADERDVSVILTGHTHYYDRQAWKTSLKQPAADIYELRAPSVMQGPANAAPNAYVVGPATANAIADYSGFLVHEISLEDVDSASQATWKIHVFLWDGAQFVPHTSNTGVPLR